MLPARTELKQNLPTPQDLGFATCVLVEANNLICLLINTPFTLPIPKLQSCCSYAVSAEQQLRNLGMIRVKRAGEPTPASGKNQPPPTPQNTNYCAACYYSQVEVCSVSLAQLLSGSLSLLLCLALLGAALSSCSRVRCTFSCVLACSNCPEPRGPLA